MHANRYSGSRDSDIVRVPGMVGQPAHGHSDLHYSDTGSAGDPDCGYRNPGSHVGARRDAECTAADPGHDAHGDPLPRRLITLTPSFTPTMTDTPVTPGALGYGAGGRRGWSGRRRERNWLRQRPAGCFRRDLPERS